MQRRFTLFPIIALLALALLAACGGAAPASSSSLPGFVQGAPQTVQQAYQFAVANPDVLAHQPCYCGCGSMGHTSNLDCYVQQVDDEGTVVYDNHAAGCGICVDITQDVMRLLDEGRSQLEIRQYIDGQYSPFGPSTDTPLPAA